VGLRAGLDAVERRNIPANMKHCFISGPGASKFTKAHAYFMYFNERLRAGEQVCDSMQEIAFCFLATAVPRTVLGPQFASNAMRIGRYLPRDKEVGE